MKGEVTDLKAKILADMQLGFRLTMENAIVRNIRKQCDSNSHPVGLKVEVFRQVIYDMKGVSEKHETIRQLQAQIAEARDGQKKDSQNAKERLICSGFKLPAGGFEFPATRTFTSCDTEGSANNGSVSKKKPLSANVLLLP